MSKHDSLQRFIFEDRPVRGEFVQLQDSIQEILNQHPYPAPVKKILAEALCAAALLTAVIKYDGRLTIQFRGKGALSLLLAQCNNQFQLRGLAKYDTNVNSDDDLLASLQGGVLAIMLDSDSKFNQYQGVVNWRGKSLAESIEGYFKNSEQLETRIWLATDDHVAVGFLLQVMPGEEQIGNKSSHELLATTDIQSTDLLTQDVETLLKTYFPENDIRLFERATMTFKCTCSRQKGENAIMIIGRDEAEAELKGKNAIEVTCDFCNAAYLFDRVDVASIFESKDNLPPNTNLH